MKTGEAHGVLKCTVDIETWGGPNKPTADDIKVPGNYKKPEAIDNYIKENLPDAWKKNAVQSLKGEIVCIGYAFTNDPPQTIIGTEEAIMDGFVNALIQEGVTHLTQVYWIGHNLAGFDLPWLLHRAWKYGNRLLLDTIPTNRYDDHVVDTMSIWAATGRDYYKLGEIAKFLGIGSKGGIDGSMIHDMFVEGRISEIAQYCEVDVDLTRTLSKILKPEIWISS